MSASVLQNPVLRRFFGFLVMFTAISRPASGRDHVMASVDETAPTHCLPRPIILRSARTAASIQHLNLPADPPRDCT